MNLPKDVLLRASGVILFILMYAVNFFIELSDAVFYALSFICIILIVSGLLMKKRQERQDKYK